MYTNPRDNKRIRNAVIRVEGDVNNEQPFRRLPRLDGGDGIVAVHVRDYDPNDPGDTWYPDLGMYHAGVLAVHDPVTNTWSDIEGTNCYVKVPLSNGVGEWRILPGYYYAKITSVAEPFGIEYPIYQILGGASVATVDADGDFDDTYGSVFNFTFRSVDGFFATNIPSEAYTSLATDPYYGGVYIGILPASFFQAGIVSTVEQTFAGFKHFQDISMANGHVNGRLFLVENPVSYPSDSGGSVFPKSYGSINWLESNSGFQEDGVYNESDDPQIYGRIGCEHQVPPVGQFSPGGLVSMSHMVVYPSPDEEDGNEGADYGNVADNTAWCTTEITIVNPPGYVVSTGAGTTIGPSSYIRPGHQISNGVHGLNLKSNRPFCTYMIQGAPGATLDIVFDDTNKRWMLNDNYGNPTDTMVTWLKWGGGLFLEWGYHDLGGEGSEGSQGSSGSGSGSGSGGSDPITITSLNGGAGFEEGGEEVNVSVDAGDRLVAIFAYYLATTESNPSITVTYDGQLLVPDWKGFFPSMDMGIVIASFSDIVAHNDAVLTWLFSGANGTAYRLFTVSNLPINSFDNKVYATGTGTDPTSPDYTASVDDMALFAIVATHGPVNGEGDGSWLPDFIEDGHSGEDLNLKLCVATDVISAAGDYVGGKVGITSRPYIVVVAGYK